MNHQQKRPFESFYDKQDVVIYLKQYGITAVPAEIGELKKARSLHITMDSSSGWTVYPPLSALRQAPPRYLPDDITQLTNLRALKLEGLFLTTLPDDFAKLQNLDSLSLFFNNLKISNEVSKLKQLRNLKYLNLSGNIVDSMDVKELKTGNPGVVIVQ